MIIKKLILAIVLFCSFHTSYAGDRFDWEEGTKAAFCANLPVGTCDLVKWENHKNLVNAIVFYRLHSVCGSINIDFIEKEIAADRMNKECKGLFERYKKEGLIFVK